jgi:hypothetical protein
VRLRSLFDAVFPHAPHQALAVQDLDRMDVLARVLRGDANCGDLRKARGPFRSQSLVVARAWGATCGAMEISWRSAQLGLTRLVVAQTHLLALCRAWGYRCDIWSQRAEANFIRRGEAAARAAQQQPVRLPCAAKRDSGELAPALPAQPVALLSPLPPRKKAKAAAQPGASRSDLHDSFLSTSGAPCRR